MISWLQYGEAFANDDLSQSIALVAGGERGGLVLMPEDQVLAAARLLFQRANAPFRDSDSILHRFAVASRLGGAVCWHS
jgi:hypothetical protein